MTKQHHRSISTGQSDLSRTECQRMLFTAIVKLNEPRCCALISNVPILSSARADSTTLYVQR